MLSVILTVFACPSAWAQITYKSRSAIKAETRKSKRDAAQVEADYKDSHLNTAHYTYKKGVAGRKKVQISETPVDYVSDKEINELDREELKKMSKKKLQPKQKKSKKITTI
ncbi:MAG: hypothetical protein COW65_12665 [Cytophagales bacterium CG18_big_fil_WC_8_21_14_2_50_42_9]|nr:MAG: hypothetical protein COW65_12665 [Cytophagales bacterium CG18_big_fil_WC_8_21_14_2_50_42_9]